MRHVVLANFKMQMRSRNPSGATYFSDDVALGNQLSLFHEVYLVMRIDRNQTAGVPKNHQVAITAQLITVDYLALADGPNGGPFRGGDVDAIMKTGAAPTKM